MRREKESRGLMYFFQSRYELHIAVISIGRSVAPREMGKHAVLAHDLDRNADDLNVVIRSLSPRIRSVNVVRVLRCARVRRRAIIPDTEYSGGNVC